MPILTPVYRSALFMKTKSFEPSDLAGFSKASKSGDGFIIQFGGKGTKCLVRPLSGKDMVIVETDDRHIRKSLVRALQISSRAKGKNLGRITISRSKALEFLRSFESDGMTEQGKLTVFYGDMATRETTRGPIKKYRTKIHFNIANSDEARKVSDRLGAEIRGFAFTLIRGDKKHRAFVFFDARPTCRITKAGRPIEAGLHEEMAKRLVNVM